MRYCEILRSVDGIGGNSTGAAIIECCRIYHGYYLAWWNDSTGAVRTTTFTDYGGTVRAAPFPSQSSGDTHGDGIQLQAGSGWEIRGNSIGGPRGYLGAWSAIDPTVAADYAIMAALDADSGYPNSAIMINGNASSPIGAMIEKNWLAGGACRVNLAPSGSDTLSGVTVRDNRFKRQSDASTPNYNILTNGCAATVSGNVWDDTGAALP